MAKKKATAPSTNNVGTIAVAHWTIEDIPAFSNTS